MRKVRKTRQRRPPVEIILTNEPDAVLLFTARVTDPARFSALFTDALVFLLASYLAGPVLLPL